jgi:hypothetical protein
LVSLKVSSRDPSTAARDNEESDGERKLGRFRLLPETPAAVCDTQFFYVLGVEWDVGMAAHRCHQRAMRDGDIFKNASVLQDHRDNMQIICSLGLIEKKLS